MKFSEGRHHRHHRDSNSTKQEIFIHMSKSHKRLISQKALGLEAQKAAAADFHWIGHCSKAFCLAFGHLFSLLQFLPFMCYLDAPFPWNCQLDKQIMLLGCQPQDNVKSQCDSD